MSITRESVRHMSDNIIRSLPDPLPVPVTAGKRGPWSISTFKLTHDDVRLENLRAVINGDPEQACKPGTYTRLHHKQRGIVMSNTPMEVRTNSAFIRLAHGSVLINGLGLGMVLRAVLSKPEVLHVVVYEIDQDVIELVSPGFKKELKSGRLSIFKEDCFAYKPERGECYDVAWHDVWDTIDIDNLPQMRALKRKWARRVGRQLCWAEDICLRDLRR